MRFSWILIDFLSFFLNAHTWKPISDFNTNIPAFEICYLTLMLPYLYSDFDV